MNQRHQTRISTLGLAAIVVVMCFVLMFMLSYHMELASTPTPTMTPNALSQFEGNECEFPCWYGLVPGESISAEVKAFVDAGLPGDTVWDTHRDSEFDPITELMLSGYFFQVHSSYRPYPYHNVLYIEDGILDWMQIDTTGFMLDDFLNAFGLPDHVQVYRPWGDYLLILTYENELAVVDIVMTDDFYRCSLFDLAEHVPRILIYSPQFAYEMITPRPAIGRTYEDATPQPRLGLLNQGAIEVPIETFVSWLHNEEARDCETVFNPLAMQATATAESLAAP